MTTSTNDAIYHLCVGVDIAATSAKVCWLVPGVAPTRSSTVEQTPQAFHALKPRLLSTGHPANSILVVMEATGSYWIGLATTLVRDGCAVSVINPAQAHHFARALLKRAKTDAIDAQTLAQLASLLHPAPWTPPPAVYAELQQRLAQRDSLLDLRQQVRNQLHALQQMPTIIATVRTRMEQLIGTLTTQLEAVEAEALTAYAGLAPYPYQSGTSVHGRAGIGHTGNGRLRTILYLATLSAAQHNPIITAFYERLRACGKPMKVARCAAARKLLHLAYAVVTRKQDARSALSVTAVTTASQNRLVAQHPCSSVSTRARGRSLRAKLPFFAFNQACPFLTMQAQVCQGSRSDRVAARP